ncbi:MAG: aminoacyltransferase [Erysipelotrichaceae bacterium]|nr:aminoacyltransferase [Erysipelotrichaceae bacterium]
MKLHETDVKHFNDLAKAEPDSTIYQTSFWSDYMVAKGYDAAFLEATDDQDICQGLTLLLMKKESVFSRGLSAYAPYGILFNYYDGSSFRQFHELFVGYLKQKKVNKLIIEPQVDADNRKICKLLEELGYEKESDLSVFEVFPDHHVNAISDPNVILKIRCEDNAATLNKLAEKNDKENLKIYENLKGHALNYIAQLDCFKSRRAIEESLTALNDYVSEHKDDYKFVEDVAEKEKQISDLKKLFNTIIRYEQKYSQDPDIAAYCVSLFSDKSTIMFRLSSDKDDLFHAEKEIIDQICADSLNRGIIRVDSGERFCYSSERKLIGRYVLKI